MIDDPPRNEKDPGALYAGKWASGVYCQRRKTIQARPYALNCNDHTLTMQKQTMFFSTDNKHGPGAKAGYEAGRGEEKGRWLKPPPSFWRI